MADATREVRFALLGDRPRANLLDNRSKSAHDTQPFETCQVFGFGQNKPAVPGYPAIEQSDRHRVVAAYASDVTDVTVHDHWQTLVADDSIDAGLLFYPDEEALEAARQLAVRGKALVVDWRCRLPSSLTAELALLDAEETAAIAPLFEWRAFPAFQQLHQLVTGGRLGEVVLLRMERSFEAVSRPDRKTLDDEWIDDSLTFDIDLLRWIGGDYSQVTLVRTGATDDGFAGQSLNLAGEGLPDATCVYRVAKESRWTFEVQGSSAIATVEHHGDGIRLSVNGEPVLTQKVRRPEAALCLRLLDDSLARRPDSLRWQDRVRVHEIQEAMQRSLKKRRTIDLHFETTSERSQFKTQMATVGCFVLVYTFFASVLLLLAGAMFDPRDQVQRQAEAAGFIVPREDFEAGRLTETGERRLTDIADRWQSTGAVIVVEGKPAEEGEAGPIAAEEQARLEAVRRRLTEHGVRRVEERTVVRRPAGQAFQKLMTFGRIIAFAPLGAFLLMQVLLLVARPAADKPSDSGDASTEIR